MAGRRKKKKVSLKKKRPGSRNDFALLSEEEQKESIARAQAKIAEPADIYADRQTEKDFRGGFQNATNGTGLPGPERARARAAIEGLIIDGCSQNQVVRLHAKLGITAGMARVLHREAVEELVGSRGDDAPEMARALAVERAHNQRRKLREQLVQTPGATFEDHRRAAETTLKIERHLMKLQGTEYERVIPVDVDEVLRGNLEVLLSSLDDDYLEQLASTHVRRREKLGLPAVMELKSTEDDEEGNPGFPRKS